MRLKMLETKDGSRNGVSLERFEKGECYDFGPSVGDRTLARIFLTEKWAIEASAEKPAAAPAAAPVVKQVEEKAIDIANADADALRAFLIANGKKPHHKAGLEKLREAALNV